MKILSAVVLYALFFLLCYLGTGSDKKNIRSFYSYPDAVQEQIRKSEQFTIPKKSSYTITFLSDTLIFTAVFVVISLLTREKNFWYYLILGEGLNAFDLLVIDLLWWQHSRRVRFTGIGTSKEYLGAKKHIEAFLRAIPVFAASAFLAAIIDNLP